MFTGLITHIGSVKKIERQAESVLLQVATPSDFIQDVQIGESIAVSGACLTVTSFDSTHFTAYVSSETLKRTTILKWRIGNRVNLERALRADTRMGGHFVMGHVDGVGVLRNSKNSGDGFILSFQSDPEIAKLVVPKGSVAIDGISLTPVERSKDSFSVAVIPHTLESTTLGKLSINDAVNIEIDIFARYVFHLLENIQDNKKSDLTIDTLREEGY